MKEQVNIKTSQAFYQNLGRLFYAIAAADKMVTREEVETVKRLVREQWLDLEGSLDEFGTDAAYQIEIIFDWLDANKPQATSAFENFNQFHKENKDLFTPYINDKILRTSREIASAFRGKNKSELVMLAKLQSLLKNQ
ncbi:hypothetical protein [Salinimicrobium flavum]|uniref:Tellurite resistance protein TerB n=1 Tax=Salinimicrobium flavum TaxID=1737065 RepID=A0ABW5J0T3_9FLAO